MTTHDPRPGEAQPHLYRDLAPWYPLLTPPEDYAEEAAVYLRLFREACVRPPHTLLDLGCGGGHNAVHLKRALTATLSDIAPRMLDLSRELNPECEHVCGDMRTVRLGRRFDTVLVHDAVVYMTTEDDLRRAVETAFVHCVPGGVALFMPDFVRETFQPGTETGGVDRDGRGLRYLEWRWDPDPAGTTYITDMAIMTRERDGTVEVAHDRHVMGLFTRAVWLDALTAAGFDARALKPPAGPAEFGGTEIFIGRRPED
jgi:SAM-dependent methyltransferase